MDKVPAGLPVEVVIRQISSEEWSYFLTRWGDYKEATNITGKDIILQLQECCDDDLRKDLTRAAGGSLTNRTEDQVLASIKKLAVREENTMVARVTLYEMRQDHSEPIRSFGARIQGQATICKFILPCASCSAEVNYTDQILRDVLVRGIADHEIQLDILGDWNQDLSLEDVFRHIEAREAGKRSANRLNPSHGVKSAKSQYRQGKNNATKGTNYNPKWTNNNAQGTTCGYCGKTGHGRNAPIEARKKDCPAYNKKCNYCNRLHHTENACRAKEKASSNEDAIFDSLCATSTSSKKPDAISLDHHTYSNMNDCWTRRPSRPQPYIPIVASVHKADYTSFGIQLKDSTKDVKVCAMADTGCQSCLVGLNVINQLGIHRDNLIPVKMRMHTANNNQITILGAVFLRLTGRDTSGLIFGTRQLVYVTDQADKLFLSQEACVQLGLISPSFLTIGEVFKENNNVSYSVETRQADSAHTTCECPKQQLPPPKPTDIPFQPTDENRERLQTWLLDYFKSSTFNTCTHQPLPMMEGPPLRLMIDSEAIPVACHTPVPVPLHWQEEIKAGLGQDVRLGVIEPVEIGEPVTWCHRMVICAKKNGKPRRTVDLHPLNAHAVRETHHTQSPFHQARQVPKHTKKTVFDCWNGYHSVPLHPDDRHYTTFITPWGRYRYKAAPQGYIASGDGFTRRFDKIVSHIPRKTKCIDDTLLWSDDLERSFWQAVEWLDVCGRHGITLNPEKFVFGADTVPFAGFEITRDSIRPARRYLDAIHNFPTPSSITDVRSWFGLVNQVSYAFATADHMLPFRQLLKPETPFRWDEELDKLFKNSKQVIAKEIEEGIAIFDINRTTCLVTDWSKTGIGFWLLQKHCSCNKREPFCCPTGWKTALVGSRFTHSNEANYAPVEGEALAVVDGLHRARFFVLGCKDLIIAVDHKPLLKIFGNRSLNDIENPRLRNLKEKTLQFQFQMIHLPGVRNKAADAISRHPSEAPGEQIHLPDDVATVHSSTTTFPSDHTSATADEGLQFAAVSSLSTFKAVTWDAVLQATNSDPTMLSLLKRIELGFPKQKIDTLEELHQYFPHREHLWTIDGVILYKNRIIIPPPLRHTVLCALHSAHQGISTMTSRAESSIFWPGLTKDIIKLRERCNDCNRIAPSQPNPPPTPMALPEYPFQCIAADYFHHAGNSYLVAVDRYSNWPIIDRAKNGSRDLINVLRRTFSTYGIPDELSSDGGPEFIANDTDQFLTSWGVHHRLSSVAYPHSNCRAEIGVKTMKRLIMTNTGPNGTLDTDTLQRAILQYRNCPDPQTKLSPAMCIFGRPVKDFIPIIPGRYKPHPTWQDTLATRENALRNRHMRCEERLSLHTRRLPPLTVGNHVRIQNQIGQHPSKWDKTGVVVEVKQFDQYRIRVDGSGRLTLRNRKFLRSYTPVHIKPPRRSIVEDLGYLPRKRNRMTHTEDAQPSDEPTVPSTERTPTTSVQTNPEIDNSSAPEHRPLSTPELPKYPLSHSSARYKKAPLALRRLMDFNAKVLNE